MMNFQTPRRIRRMAKGNHGRFRGGQIVPVMAHAVRGSEGGLLQQRVAIEVDPIPGRLVSEMWAEVVNIFVPLQAIDALKNPEADYPGMTEVLREKLLSGTPPFVLENEGVITKKMKINPRSVGGAKKVNEVARLAYICAVNLLRQRLYFRATLLPHTHTAIAPAVYAQTVLDKINGVLDPDDRINGVVQLEIPAMQLPVSGIGIGTVGVPTPNTNFAVRETGQTGLTTYPRSLTSSGADDIHVRVTGDTGATARTDIYAEFNAALQGVSLTDFYNAEKQDMFARVMDQMMNDNPQYGFEMVLRWAHGLSVDAGKLPFIITERRVQVNKGLTGAMDTQGVEDEVVRTDAGISLSYTVPIPKTELGGVIVTMISLKPDEKLASQPEPFLSDVWGADNFVADTLALDPVAVTVRDLYSDCATLDETNIVAWTGLNALKETYVDYGFARDLDLADVEQKTALWQLETPLSVNPDNVNYPAYLDHGIFPFGGTQLAPEDVAHFSINSIQSSPTPMIVGPTPVEDIGPEADPIFDEEA